MGHTGRVTDVMRATEVLRGILAGISADYELSDPEIAGLEDWLYMHANLLAKSPFLEVRHKLDEVLADGIIDEDERQELLEWCFEFSSPHSYPVLTVTAGIRRLHGFLQGISLDGAVSDSEIHDLADWLRDYEPLRENWPFDEVWTLVENILKDKRVTESERQALLDFCRNFSEYPVDRHLVCDEVDTAQEPWMASEAPVLMTLEHVCDRAPGIKIENRVFCFTGHLSYGKRSKVKAVVEQLRGIVKNSVVSDLDYLVIGALSQPCWAYSTYGRKVEAVMDLRKRGISIAIVHESDFLNALTLASRSES